MAIIDRLIHNIQNGSVQTLRRRKYFLVLSAEANYYEAIGTVKYRGMHPYFLLSATHRYMLSSHPYYFQNGVRITGGLSHVNRG